jgi:hypothetical protein
MFKDIVRVARCMRCALDIQRGGREGKVCVRDDVRGQVTLPHYLSGKPRAGGGSPRGGGGGGGDYLVLSANNLTIRVLHL